MSLELWLWSERERVILVWSKHWSRATQGPGAGTILVTLWPAYGASRSERCPKRCSNCHDATQGLKLRGSTGDCVSQNPYASFRERVVVSEKTSTVMYRGRKPWKVDIGAEGL